MGDFAGCPGQGKAGQSKTERGRSISPKKGRKEGDSRARQGAQKKRVKDPGQGRDKTGQGRRAGTQRTGAGPRSVRAGLVEGQRPV